MYRVLIVDDHESVSDSLCNAFGEVSEFMIVGSLKDAAYAEVYCVKLKPDLVIMDVCTKEGSSGLEATKIIREKSKDIKVIVMSGFDEITYSFRAKEAGADAFISKSRSLEYFVESAQKVMQGEKIFPEEQKVTTEVGGVYFTDREIEVLRLLCKHMTTKEIAEKLFISEHTVKYHKSNMLSKTGFKKTIDLAFYMISNGLINPLY